MQKAARNLALSILFLLLAQNTFAQSQIDKGKLVLDEMITAEISPIETHRYALELAKDQFVLLRLMQIGVDMKLATYDTQGEKMEDFDSPNGKFGPEIVTLNSTKKGNYIIEVVPFNEEEPPGEYQIMVELIKPKAKTLADQVDEVFAPWDNKSTPGAAVAFVKDGEIIFKKGYGLANLEYDIPIEPNSVFHIASISKQFTVFAILLLEKEGKLSLDDDIRKHIPEMPDFGQTITLRHLAAHTSGLRDQWNLLGMAGWRLDDVITTEQVLKLVSRQKELNFAPGEEFLYCNTGFTLLAETVARVSEMSFAEFTAEHIFEPLNMNSTLFYDDHERVVKNRTYSYYSDGSGHKKSVLNYANVGATSLFTTVEDLSLWAMNFSDIKVGDAEIIKTMNTRSVLNNGVTVIGALGQFTGNYKGLTEFQHGGADAGYRTYMTRFPDQNAAVIVFSNSAEFNPSRAAYKMVDIYLKDRLFELPEPEAPSEVASEGEPGAEPATKPTETASTNATAIDPAVLATYQGNFELQPGFVINITEENGSLYAQPSGEERLKLVALSETEFEVPDVEAKIEFVPNEGEKVKLLKLHQAGQIREAPRAQPFDKASVALEEFAGVFYSEELATSYEFIVIDGKLVARHSRLSDFKLNPAKEDFFTGESWYFNQIKFIRDTEQKITGCTVSNGRVRNLHFDKID